MNKKTLIPFIATLVIFCMLLTACALVLGIMPAEDNYEGVDLSGYYKDKKQEVLDSIKDVAFVNVEDYIKDNGDPVIGINKALEENRHLYFPKTLDISLQGKLSIKSNTIIKFDTGCKLAANFQKISSPFRQCLFLIYGASNVTILGNGTTLRFQKQSTQGEEFPGICIYGGKDVNIFDINIDSVPNTGIVVSRYLHTQRENYPSENINLMNIAIRNSRGGGLLVESAHTLRVYKLEITSSARLLTEAAILLKTSRPNDLLSNIMMHEIYTKNNEGVSFVLMPGTKVREEIYVTIKNYTSINDGGFAPIYFMNSPHGEINITSFSAVSKHNLGGILRTWDTRQCPITIRDTTVGKYRGFPYIVTDKLEDEFPSNTDKLKIKNED